MVDKEEEEEHFDCLLVGAGISGLDAAYHIQKQASWATFAILERRGNLGGTWDFFKYPGLRCDSKMYTFGFYWKPWESVEPIASKEEIQTYLREAAEEQCLLERIKFNTDIVKAQGLFGRRMASVDQGGSEVQLQFSLWLHWILFL